MVSGYEYHVFISYNRSGDVGEWVRTHFHPVLRRRLESVLKEEPRIFIDEKLDVGSDWPHSLADALHKSSYMLAVWTPSYFRSKWCMAEWETILERERRSGLRAPGHTGGLVYPVVYSDGESFPEEAKRIQSRLDLHDYAYPYEQFKKTEKYLHFFDKVTDIANELKTRLDTVPQWDAEWPRLRPDPEGPAAPHFARL